MKENVGDKVVDLLHKRREAVRAKLQQQYKNVKPFRMQPVSDEELLSEYEQLGQEPERMNDLISNYGEDVVGEFIFEMEKLKLKRRK